MRQRKPFEFPDYTSNERRVDTAIHILGVVGSILGAIWLLSTQACCLSDAECAALIIYTGSFCGTMLSSAAYHFAPSGRSKEIIRRIDHAMIFAMIAGTYTPFAVHYLSRSTGEGVGLWFVWGVALVGIALKLTYPRRFERIGLVLYLGLGWALVVLAQPMWASLSTPILVLLGVGGVLYTLGTVAHVLESVPYHNAAWHALVLIAAASHYAAVVLETVP